MAFLKSKSAQSPCQEVVTISDSDEEVFFGPVTDKEKKKASKLSRRTQVFFPPAWRLRSNNQLSVEPRSSPYLSKAESNVGEAHLSGYTADVSTTDRTEHVTEVDSLESAISVDSLNSLSKDSLDVDRDSLEKSKLPETSDHSSLQEDLYDVNDYVVPRPSQALPPSDPGTNPTPERRFMSLEMDELQKQLEALAADLQRGESRTSEERNSSPHERDATPPKKLVSSPEKLDASGTSIPSPYDLNKQKLTASLLYDSRIDSSSDSNVSPLKALAAMNRLDTLNEVSEPSSTDLESRLSNAHLSESKKASSTMSPAARRIGSARSTPKQLRLKTTRTSTQLFEEFERQFEEEERLSGPQDPQTTYTVFTEEDSLDSSVSSSVTSATHHATYTIASDTTSVQSFTYSTFPRENDAEYVDSVNSSHQEKETRNDISSGSYDQMSDSCELNDTLEEYEMLMKYGVDYIYGKHHKNASHREESTVKESQSSERRSSGFVRSAVSEECITSKSSQLRKFETSPVQKSLKSLSTSKLASGSHTPKVPRAGCVPQSEPPKVRRALSQRSTTPRTFQGSARLSPQTCSAKSSDVAGRRFASSAESTTPSNPRFKVPSKIPQSACRLPRVLNGAGHATPSPRPSKFLNAVQSPIGAYIHNSPAPALLQNIKPKTCSSTVQREHEKKQRPVWENIDALRNQKGESCENANPNVGHGLRVVHYTQAPCIKLDDPSLPKPRLPRLGERYEKLLDSPCPQVIRHEGRVRVNPSSPQFTAAVKAVRSNLNDSAQSESAAGDISVCVSKIAKRTNTLCQ